jgi:hypothetical protein
MTKENRMAFLMANIMNYLNVSFYEGCFTYYHEQARLELNQIAEAVAIKETEPSLEDCILFRENIIILQSVIDTDDPTFHSYMHELSSLIESYKRNSHVFPSLEENASNVWWDGELGPEDLLAIEQEEQMYQELNQEREEEWWESEDLLRLERQEHTERIRWDMHDDDD